MLQRAPTLTVLCQHGDDLTCLRRLDPKCHAMPLEDAIGIDPGNVVVLARGDGLETLKGANLGLSGRVLDLGSRGTLAGWMVGRGDVSTEIDANAVDLFWHEERPISRFEFPKLKDGESCGIVELNPHLRWTDRGELIITVGPYGCGKSSLMRLLAYHWVNTIGRERDQRLSICAWEDHGSIIKREIERFVTGRDTAIYPIFDNEISKISDMENRVGWTQRHPDEARLLDWYIELVEYRARRDNVGFFIFDPWNEHDIVRRRDQTETEYVREMMVRLQALCARLKININVVTHVSAKSYDENGAVKPFRTANAYGSSNFGSKATRAICMLRTKSLADSSSIGAEQHMVMHFDKAKHEETMGHPGTVAMRFNPFVMSLTYDAGATAEVRKIWP